MSDVTIAQLEARKEELRKLAQLIESHDRLMKNRDFRSIILEGFMLHECARYAQESADPLLTQEQRTDALLLAQAAGHLKRYLNISYRMAQNAVRDIASIDEAIAAMREEGED